jgi:hypothetical protein
MDATSPIYLRARIDMIRDVLSKSDAKDFHVALLRNGVFPKDRDEKELVEVYAKQKEYSNEPLSFTELCTFNTWFERYPQKVCGEQEITTSREFPLTIKGDKSGIINTIGHVLGDFNLILDLPGDWYIHYHEPEDEDFYVHYKCGTYLIQLYTNGLDYNFQIQNGDFLLENINYREIKDANTHALRFMQLHPLAYTKVSVLEIEALSLEYELQLKTL